MVWGNTWLAVSRAGREEGRKREAVQQHLSFLESEVQNKPEGMIQSWYPLQNPLTPLRRGRVCAARWLKIHMKGPDHLTGHFQDYPSGENNLHFSSAQCPIVPEYSSDLLQPRANHGLTRPHWEVVGNSITHQGLKNKHLKATSWACWASQKGGERQSELWCQRQQVSRLTDDEEKQEVAGVCSVPVVLLKRGFLSPRAQTGKFWKAI